MLYEIMTASLLEKKKITNGMTVGVGNRTDISVSESFLAGNNTDSKLCTCFEYIKNGIFIKETHSIMC